MTEAELLDPLHLLKDSYLHHHMHQHTLKHLFYGRSKPLYRARISKSALKELLLSSVLTFPSYVVDRAKHCTSPSRCRTSEENASLRASRARSAAVMPEGAPTMLAVAESCPLACLLKLDSIDF